MSRDSRQLLCVIAASWSLAGAGYSLGAATGYYWPAWLLAGCAVGATTAGGLMTVAEAVHRRLTRRG